jgi:hypothetical protein
MAQETQLLDGVADGAARPQALKAGGEGERRVAGDLAALRCIRRWPWRDTTLSPPRAKVLSDREL